MTPSEVVLIIDAKRPKSVGSMHEDDLDELHNRHLKLEAEGVKML